MNIFGLILLWLLLQTAGLLYILEHYPWKLLKRPSNYLLPTFWIIGNIFAGVSTGIALSESSETFEILIKVGALIQTTLSACACKMMFHYRHSLYALVLSGAALMQGTSLCAFLGLSSTLAALLYIPYLLILICTQLIYGFVLHRRGLLAKKVEMKDIDLNLEDADILSNYIKLG